MSLSALEVSGLLAVDPGEPRAGEAVEEKQARCPEKQRLGVRNRMGSHLVKLLNIKTSEK